MKAKTLLLCALVAVSLANALTIQGTVFNASLKPVDSIVEIDNPRQVYAAVNGTYFFNVKPNSNYTLIARTAGNEPLLETAQLSVETQDIRFDFVLLTPEGLDTDAADINETLDIISQPATPFEVLEDNLQITWIIAALLAALVVGIYLLHNKREKKESASPTSTHVQQNVEKRNEPQKIENEEKIDEFKREVLKLLKEKGGAADQKELRRELPWSEARVSIELSELEKMGKVKKIKRGRANLVKLT